MATVTGTYVASGRNPDLEKQYLRLTYSNTSITVSGTTASTSVTAKMEVKRDSYGTTYGLDASCYITINGNKKTYTYDGTVDDSWRTIMSHTVKVNYDASAGKSVSLGAGFSISSNEKLKGLVLPASSYAYGKGTQSGSLTLSLPKQITKCGAPSKITVEKVSGSGSIVAPKEKIKISWSGATNGTSNKIASYQIYYKAGSSPTATSSRGMVNVNVTDGTTSGSTTITLACIDEDRGDKLYVGIIARGTAGSSYYSPIKTVATSFSVNRLPPTPTVSKNKDTVKSSGDDVIFTVNKGSDADGQSLSLYYSTTETGSKTLFTSPLTYNITKDKNKLFFFSYDGMEYSKYTNTSVNINNKPIINSITSNKTIIDNSDPSFPLVRKASYSASINKVVTSYTWYFSQSSSSSIDTSIKTSFSDLNILENYDFGGLDIIKGNYYKIGLIVSDGYESSDILWETGTSRMPQGLSGAIINAVYNSPNGQNVEGTSLAQFEKGLTIKWTNPSIPVSGIKISSAKAIYRIRESGSSVWGNIIVDFDKNNEPNASNTSYLNLDLTRGTQVQIGVRLIDTDNDNVDTFYSTIFTRAKLPVFGDNTLNVTGPEEDGILTVKPYTNITPLAFMGIKVTSDNGAKYSVECSIDDRGIQIPLITDRDKSQVEQGDTINITLPASEINELLKNDLLKENPYSDVWNTFYQQVKYRIYAEDNFGNRSSNLLISSNTQINFQQ